MHFFVFLTTGGSSAATIACKTAVSMRVRRVAWGASEPLFEIGTHLVKDVLQTLLCQRRALHILHRAKLPSKPLALFWGNRTLLLPRQLVQHLWVVPEIDLGADDEARHTGAVMVHLREPLLLHVLKRRGRRHAETDEEHIRLGV